MNPCWKMMGERAVNMNNIATIEKTSGSELLWLYIIGNSNKVCVHYPTEAERDEAFEYLMRDDKDLQ